MRVDGARLSTRLCTRPVSEGVLDTLSALALVESPWLMVKKGDDPVGRAVWDGSSYRILFGMGIQ